MLSGSVMVIFKNSKIFEGPVIFRKNTQLSCFFSLLIFSLIFSCLSSSVLSLLLHRVSSFISDLVLSFLWSLLSSLILSCLFSSCLSFSVSLCLSLSVSVSLCLCLRVVVCGVWCGTQKKPPCVDSKRPRVYRHHASTAQRMTARRSVIHPSSCPSSVLVTVHQKKKKN